MEEKRSGNSAAVSDTLKKTFGFQGFRPHQEEIIQSILHHKDVFAVMPTGGGKSLCYQLPARIMKGTTVVISPLISLMKDQVDAALENGISAAFINSSLARGETASVYRRLKSNSLDLLYIAPERFAMTGFLETLQTIPLSLFAIDEAHCISEWGHDFRPDYLSLSNITKTFPDIPVAAFTATATARVQSDIITKLGLRSPLTVRILQFLGKHAGNPGIIYRTTRDSVSALAEMLKAKGIKALPYHAGLTQEERKAHQEAFNRDEVQVIVATIAFGMGIDKSNVRFVIHADLPKNMEGYYQETGRAGRDGEPADCVLFFGRGDIPKIKYFIDQIADDKERSIVLEKLNQMVRYASHNVCRRRNLLAYFGEHYEDDNCGACDICSGTAVKVDITIDAQKLMSAISRTGQRFGVTHIVDIVSGADTKRIRDLGHEKIKTYGAGRDRDKNHWRFIADELLAQEAIEQDGDRYPVLKLTEKGKKILFGGGNVNALKREEPQKKRSARADIEFDTYDEVLFEKLRTLRKGLADEQHVPPYIIFSDKTLHDMCRYYPATASDMSLISGVGDVKLEHYGNDFIKTIKTYLYENPDISPPGRGSYTIHPEQTGNRTKGETIEKTYEFFLRGLSVEQIAATRNLTRATITGHIEQMISDGRDIDMDRLINPSKRDEIVKLFLTLQSWYLNPVIEHFRGKVSYDEAKFVRAYMRRRKDSSIVP
jgi:ATP-dependent DNA helicase RecQ